MLMPKKKKKKRKKSDNWQHDCPGKRKKMQLKLRVFV